jgi:hypothetical protein
MKRVFFVAIIFLVCSLQAQPYQVGRISINFKDVTRTGGTAATNAVQMPGTGRDIGTEIFYPASTAGSLVPLANGTFPVVVLGHGFVMTINDYDNVYNKLASEGFIVALPRTEGSLSPNHLAFGLDIAFLGEAVKNLNTASTPTALSIFNGKVSSKSALGGHSMGGGCSLIGAQSNTNITCVFNMAAALSNTAGISSLAGASLVTVPALYLSAQRDCVVDTIVQNNHYTNTSSSKKFQVILKDMTHCDFGNGASSLCVLGQNSSGCPNSVSNSILFTRYMNYLVPFLKNQLMDDCPEGVRFMDSITTSSSLRTGQKITGTIACVTGIEAYESKKLFSCFPNPASEKMVVKLNAIAEEQLVVKLTDLYGKMISVPQVKSNSEIHLDISELKNGIYFLTVHLNGRYFVEKVVVAQKD